MRTQPRKAPYADHPSSKILSETHCAAGTTYYHEPHHPPAHALHEQQVRCDAHERARTPQSADQARDDLDVRDLVVCVLDRAAWAGEGVSEEVLDGEVHCEEGWAPEGEEAGDG